MPWIFDYPANFSTLAGCLQTINGAPLNVDALVGAICSCFLTFFATPGKKVKQKLRKFMMRVLVAAIKLLGVRA